MPEMNGIETLTKINEKGSSVGVVMISSHTKRGAAITIKALELGAFDFIAKPEVNTGQTDRSKEMIKRQLKPIINGFISKKKIERVISFLGLKQLGQEVDLESEIEIVVIGISTGGPGALSQLIPEFPSDFPVPIMIVQHMPELFTSELAESLNKKSKLNVKEAENNEQIKAGNVYIAKGGKQMKVDKDNKAIISLTDAPSEKFCKPSVNYLFRSIAQSYGKNVLAVIMTGMGDDGVAGLKSLKKVGATIFAQSESSCAVFGMPQEAIKTGVVDKVYPLKSLEKKIVERVLKTR